MTGPTTRKWKVWVESRPLAEIGGIIAKKRGRAGRLAYCQTQNRSLISKAVFLVFTNLGNETCSYPISPRDMIITP